MQAVFKPKPKPDMKLNYHFLSLKTLFSTWIIALAGVVFYPAESKAQIWAPEGLNLPGAWNSWTNPPANNLALASYTQVPGGRVTKISSGITRWQTIFSVAASGGDIVGGSYGWLFTSGPSTAPWNNKWGGVTVAMNTLQNYTKGGADNAITVVNDKWYTMNWKDAGYVNTSAIFMETSASPVDITSVSMPAGGTANLPETITITLSGTPSPEELFYIHYSTNAWSSSSLVAVNMSGTTGTAEIPGQPDGTTVSYYAFSSTVSTITSNHSLYSIKFNNNGGSNYSYLVGQAPISWANLQSPATGSINPGESLDVFAQAYIAGLTGQATPAPGLEAWIGYSSSNTNPDTWTNWIPASYTGPAGSNDEFSTAIGTGLTPGTYYYASRFRLNTGPYVYGGYNSGFWNGTANISGILTVNGAEPTVVTGSVSSITGNSAVVEGNVISDGGSIVTERGICWGGNPGPTLSDNYVASGSGTGVYTAPLSGLLPGMVYYARAYATNTTGTGYGSDVQFTTPYAVTFIVDMSTASGFIPGTDVVYLAGNFPGATWNEPGSNPAMMMTQGSGSSYSLTLILPAGSYEFKHFMNAGWGGGEWTGGDNRSVTVTANTTINSTWGGEITWANLQYPENGVIETGTSFNVYAQAFIPNGRTGGSSAAYGLQAWIGYSNENTSPENWTQWIPCTFLGASFSNDEFIADLGQAIATPGVYYYASRFQLGNGNFVYGGYNSGYWNGTTNVSGVLTVNEPVLNKTLSLKLFLEGLYSGSGQMSSAKDENGLPVFGSTIADTLSIELHDALDFTTIVHQVHGVNLSVSGDILLSGSDGVPASVNGSYYIVIRHRNSILTSSATPVSFAGASISYDFSTSALQAFGANLQLMDGVYALFAGDENQDGLLDSSDMIDADNDAAAFSVGYLPTDINGDGLIDSSDMIFIDNNVAAFVAAALP